jgi:hypothetical protein
MLAALFLDTNSGEESRMNQTLSEEELLHRKEKLGLLAAKRKLDSWGYKNLADFHGGAHECEFVSPNTKTAGNVASDIFVALQDWASEDVLSGPVNLETVRLGYTPGMPTDDNLISLLEEHFGLTLCDIYATNAFPFIKPGSISSQLPPKVLRRAAEVFCLPQIRVIAPRLVIALGLDCFNALSEALGMRRAARLETAISNPIDDGGTRVWCQAHTGHWGEINRGGKARVSEDWRTMTNWYNGPQGAKHAA